MKPWNVCRKIVQFVLVSGFGLSAACMPDLSTQNAGSYLVDSNPLPAPAPILNQVDPRVNPFFSVPVDQPMAPIFFYNTLNADDTSLTFKCSFDTLLDGSFSNDCNTLPCPTGVSCASFINGILLWTPPSSAAWGTYEFLVTATDSFSRISSDTFLINVRQSYPTQNLSTDLDGNFSKLTKAATAGEQVFSWKNLSLNNFTQDASLLNSSGSAWSFGSGYDWTGTGTSTNPYALGFNAAPGNKNFLNLGNVVANQTQMTLSLWISPLSTVTGGSIIMSNGGEIGNGFVLRHAISDATKLEFLVGPSSSQQTYSAGTQALSPNRYWRLSDDTTASTVVAAAAGIAGAYTAGLALLRQPSHFIRDVNSSSIGSSDLTAALFDGRAQIATEATVELPSSTLNYSYYTNYSVEVWFKTAQGYLGGGPIVNLGESISGISDYTDRTIYMSQDGSINFGVLSVDAGPTLSCHVLNSQTPYNDGNWHHVVGTLSNTAGLVATQTLYIDGLPAGPGTSTFTAGLSFSNIAGYWHMGGDSIKNLTGCAWPNTNQIGKFFKGAIEDFAVYHGALSSTQINNHITALSRSSYLQTILNDQARIHWGFDTYFDGSEGVTSLAGKYFQRAQFGVATDTSGFSGFTPNLPTITTSGGAIFSTNTTSYAGESTDQHISFNGAAGQWVYGLDQVHSTNDFTVEFWLKTPNTTNNVSVLGLEDQQALTAGINTLNTHYALSFYIDGSGILNFKPMRCNDDGLLTGTGHTINDNTWHHVLLTSKLVAGDILDTLYIDGTTSVASTTYPISCSAINGYWKLGGGLNDNLSPNRTYYTGYLDNFVTYPSALSTITTHFLSAGSTLDDYLMAFYTDGPNILASFNNDTNGISGISSRTVNDLLRLVTPIQLPSPISPPTAGSGADVSTGEKFTGINSIATTGNSTSAGTTSFADASGSFTIETWFNESALSHSTNALGGKIVGFGSSNLGISKQYDRHIYLTDSGQVVFGVLDKNGAIRAITSTSTFRDNLWHFVAAVYDGTNATSTAGIATLYVDGNNEGTLTALPSLFNYVGYWSIGGGLLSQYDQWPSVPQNPFYSGWIRDFAIIPTVLTQSQVITQFNLASESCTANLIPSGQTFDGTTWHHVGVLFDGINGTLILDGSSGPLSCLIGGDLTKCNANCVFGNTVLDSTLPVTVGSDRAGTYPWRGKIGDIKVYRSSQTSDLFKVYNGTKMRFGQ